MTAWRQRLERRRPWWPATLGCALAVALLSACGPDAVEGEEAAFDEDEFVTQEDSEQREEPADAGEEPRPTVVEIPAIDVEAELVDLGLADDRSMEVPAFGLAGWYAEGPKPGAPGPSVIAAHYDSVDGPDVFYRLQELDAGDEVHVHRADGSTVTFTVDELEQTDKDELPGDRIWRSTDEPVLTLITCGGVFDGATGHYTDNVIAYAS